MTEEAVDLCALIGEELNRIKAMVSQEREALANIAYRRATKTSSKEDAAAEVGFDKQQRIIENIETYADRVRDLAARKEELMAAIEKARTRKIESVIQEKIVA